MRIAYCAVGTLIRLGPKPCPKVEEEDDEHGMDEEKERTKWKVCQREMEGDTIGRGRDIWINMIKIAGWRAGEGLRWREGAMDHAGWKD